MMFQFGAVSTTDVSTFLIEKNGSSRLKKKSKGALFRNAFLFSCIFILLFFVVLNSESRKYPKKLKYLLESVTKTMPRSVGKLRLFFSKVFHKCCQVLFTWFLEWFLRVQKLLERWVSKRYSQKVHFTKENKQQNCDYYCTKLNMYRQPTSALNHQSPWCTKKLL